MRQQQSKRQKRQIRHQRKQRQKRLKRQNRQQQQQRDDDDDYNLKCRKNVLFFVTVNNLGKRMASSFYRRKNAISCS